MTALVRNSRTDEALRIVDAAAARPLSATQRTRIGWCNVVLGRYRIAYRQFRRVVATHRGRAYAMLGLAVSLWRLHRYRDAVAAFEAYFRLRGPGWTGVNPYVCALLDLGRVDDAVRTAEELYARYPDESAAIAGLARVRLHQGRAAEAATIAEAGTRRWSLRSLNWYCWGEALRMQGDPEGAIAKFRQLYAQEMPVPECVTGWARALVDLGRNEEALAKFAEAEKIDNEDARNYLHWGNALRRIGRTANGDALIAKAHKLAAKQELLL
jgi:tetratricopeptide (TPR) repeat protein